MLTKLKISTIINVNENINGDEIERIREDFEEMAWSWDDSIYQPRVIIEEITGET